MKDTRLPEYHYWSQLMIHLEGNTKTFFNRELVYPRQFEIHLPGNHKISCDFNCPHCAGRKFQKDLGTWELTGLALLEKLQGKIPYHIYGGAYTEPTLNPYFMSYLAMTKRHGNHFGIHTHGAYLLALEKHQGFLTELNRLSTSRTDYLSVSIDAGLASAWGLTKGTKHINRFHDIINGLKCAIALQHKSSHAIRLCYLISPYSDTIENFTSIVAITRDIGIDSLRFSIPFAYYNQTFDEVRGYKHTREMPMDTVYRERLAPFLSISQNEKPYIFYTGPEFTDIEKFDFNHCIYCYYQITYAADGYAYKCSTTATPTMAMCRLGEITDNLDKFHKLLMLNANPDWDANTCFSKGARCNRMGLEINLQYKEITNEAKIKK